MIRVSSIERLDALKGPLVVACSGGRSYTDVVMIARVLDRVQARWGIRLLIEGACPVGDGGADSRCRAWAIAHEINCLSVPPKVRTHQWPAAGPLRNLEMGNLHPGLWVLFPGGRGTVSARETAQQLDIPTIEVTEEIDPVLSERWEILRRIAERGKESALQANLSNFADLFQHLLDELQRT